LEGFGRVGEVRSKSFSRPIIHKRLPELLKARGRATGL
jgi:hypothetical protein